jgi:hypothetical protein
MNAQSAVQHDVPNARCQKFNFVGDARLGEHPGSAAVQRRSGFFFFFFFFYRYIGPEMQGPKTCSMKIFHCSTHFSLSLGINSLECAVCSSSYQHAHPYPYPTVY